MVTKVLEADNKVKIAGDVFANAVYADIHVHPTTKPLVLRHVDSPWQSLDLAGPEERKKRSIRYTQCDYTKLFNANTRVIAHFLHIPERFTFSKLLTSPSLFSRAWGMDVNMLRNIVCNQPFKVLQQELEMFQRESHDPHSNRSVEVAQNYNHLKQIIADPDKLAILLCIEGAHNLGFEFSDSRFPSPAKNVNLTNRVEPAEEITEKLIDERTDFMKKHHVFMLTLNHFVYNQLASMPKAVELTGLKKILPNPARSLDHLGSYRGLTFLGYYFVERCFEKNIFIDVKHCDAVTRHQIYAIAQKYNKPVIASHVAVSGRKTNFKNHNLLNPIDRPKDRMQNIRFNPWDINLHDDDLIAIHASGGLIGLILDERVLGSMKAVHIARKSGRWTELVYLQIEHIYKVLVQAGFPPAQCLDSVCLGSDFDGFIDPIDDITSATDLRFLPHIDSPNTKKLDTELLAIFQERINVFAKTGLSPEQIVVKIMSRNVFDFLSKNFI